ncbi:hypothetical protein H5410_063429 [Solanum commersonii]|uniref:Uncharacterized protein n=1 Tax=Solanum commersonii TaxID=4109 RepID=A0A9J5WEA9_SOLCO|nr:hypothetical protein H5410_063429 [Solanum commersonii]
MGLLEAQKTVSSRVSHIKANLIVPKASKEKELRALLAFSLDVSSVSEPLIEFVNLSSQEVTAMISFIDTVWDGVILMYEWRKMLDTVAVQYMSLLVPFVLLNVLVFSVLEVNVSATSAWINVGEEMLRKYCYPGVP